MTNVEILTSSLQYAMNGMISCQNQLKKLGEEEFNTSEGAGILAAKIKGIQNAMDGFKKEAQKNITQLNLLCGKHETLDSVMRKATTDAKEESKALDKVANSSKNVASESTKTGTAAKGMLASFSSGTLSSINEVTSKFGVNLTGLQGSINKVTSVTGVFNKSLLASPIGIISMAVVALVGVFKTFKAALASTSEGQETLNEVSGMFHGIITGLKQVIFDVLKPFTDWIIKSGALQTALSGVSVAVGAVSGLLKGVMKWASEATNVFGNLSDVVNHIFHGEWSKAMSSAKKAAESYKNSLKGLGEGVMEGVNTVKEATTTEGKYAKAVRESENASAKAAIAKNTARESTAKYVDAVRSGTASEEQYQSALEDTKNAYDGDIEAKKKLLKAMKDLHAASNSTQQDLLEEQKLEADIKALDKERALAVNQVERAHRSQTKASKSSTDASDKQSKSTKTLTNSQKDLIEEAAKLLEVTNNITESWSKGLAPMKKYSDGLKELQKQGTEDAFKAVQDIADKYHKDKAFQDTLLSGNWIMQFADEPAEVKKKIYNYLKECFPDEDLSSIAKQLGIASSLDLSNIVTGPLDLSHTFEVTFENIAPLAEKTMESVEELLSVGGIDFDSSALSQGINSIYEGFKKMQEGGVEAASGVGYALTGLGSVLSTSSQAYSSYIKKQVEDGKMSEREGKKRLKSSAQVQAAGTIATSIGAGVTAVAESIKTFGVPAGPIVGGALAATLLASGIVASQQILQAANGSVSSASTPSISAPSYSMPAEVTSVTPTAQGNISGSIDQSSASQPVLVVESLNEVQDHMTQVKSTSTL